MPIDPSIALNIKPVQLQNPLEQYGQVAQLQSLANQNRLADLVYGEKQREAEQNNAMNALYKSAVGADGQIDRAKLMTSAAQGGLGSRIPAMQKSLSEADKAAYETQKLKIESNLKQLDLVGQVAGSVKDQQSFERAKAILASQGIPTNGMGDTYNPQIVEQIATMALSAKDRLANEWKAKEFGLDQQKFDETKRSNQATEGISRGNLAVAQGNLGVSRERLNFDKAQPKGQYDAERGVIVDPRTGVARPVIGAGGQPLPDKSQAKKEASAKSLIPLLDEADKLVDGATGSYIGYGADQAARAFGKVTEGSKNVAQLKVLEGNLMLNQPRMEGPQSDKDVMMYRQMAGQIGDPTVPREIKKAALSTIRKITEKYAGVSQPSVSTGGVPDDIAALLQKHGGK